VRAYGEAASEGLNLSGVQELFLTDQVRVTTEFSIYDQLDRLIRRLGATQVNSDFSDRVELLLEVRKSRTSALVDEITQLSSGKAVIEKV